ncbi:hypothetical protein [Pseudomonas sp. NFX224]|uniref:hypothetical protein n=1 Tax=Pseudomonas sp. NFX224 TaxID=3402862 RepID=UPI003AFB658A
MKVKNFQALLIGTLCLGASGLAAVTYNHHQQLGQLLAAASSIPADPTPALRRDIDALDKTLTALQPQLVSLGDVQRQQTSAQAVLSKRLDEMAAALKTVQALPRGPSSADITGLEQRLGKAEAAIQTLSTRPTAQRPDKVRQADSGGQKAEAKAPTPPLTLLGIETRGGVGFVSALPAGAHSLSTVHLLQPGDSMNGWQLQAIREDQVVFHVPGRGDRTLPLP